jgi:hypothetical protein
MHFPSRLNITGTRKCYIFKVRLASTKVQRSKKDGQWEKAQNEDGA